MDNTLTIPVGKNGHAMISEADRDLVSSFRWSKQRSGTGGCKLYAKATIDGTLQLMHRLVLGLTKDDPREVDHKDGNGLNNSRDNLRIGSRAENRRNSVKTSKSCTSKFKGVYRDQNRWIAQIRVNGRKIRKSFSREMDAVAAYDAAAKLHFGEFAKTNS